MCSNEVKELAFMKDILPIHFGTHFATTPWAIVAQTSSVQSYEVQTALATLFELYWYPIYAFARRQGNDSHRAQDLVQGFFLHLLEKQAFEKVEREKGRFRAFLLMAFKRYAANVFQKETSLKRGGQSKIQSLDFQYGEDRYGKEPFHTETPERIYNREWVTSQVDRAMANLKAFYEAAGKLPLFEVLKGHLTREENLPHAVLAEKLGLSRTALKVTLFRMRQKFSEFLEKEISQTIDSSEGFETELRFFLEQI